MSHRARKVCFTVNNYSNQCWEALKHVGVESCKYMVIGKETSESGTSHLQGFCILKKQMRLSAVTKLLTCDNRIPHTECARGSNDQAADYCKKDGVFFEHGCYPKGKGSRTDIKDYLEAVKRGADDEVLAEEHPECYAKYTRAKEQLRNHLTKKRNFQQMKEAYSDAKLRSWQKIVFKKLSEQTDRKITWVYDPVGNMGKSWLANYLVAQHGAFLVEGGKRGDVAYAYNFEDIVVFDYTRSQEEQVNYSLIESFKNGRIFSSKYDSGLKLFSSCTVLCLSNFDPDRTKLSEDRWQVLEFPDWETNGEPPKKKRRGLSSHSRP